MATEGGKLFAGRIPRGKLDPRFGTALRCGGYMLAGFVTACARVQESLGAKVVSVLPEVTFLSTAQFTAST